MIGSDHKSKKVAQWLMLGVVMTMIQIALGGITRLTGSGLSITEWDVVTGTLPPLNDASWIQLFEKYKTTPQFHLLNFDFTLANFKFIFFWEWFHRLWARSIGLVFAFGFIYFFAKKYFQSNMIKPLLVLFLLGALQGAIGWIMVASGLQGDAVYVKPTRLALHFIFALGLLAYTYWFALKLSVQPIRRNSGNQEATDKISSIRKWAWVILLFIFFQLIYGALMAGHKAANVASTWPTINGQWIPTGLLSKDQFLLNAVNNTIWIHFVHRGLAYVLLVLIIIWSTQLFKLQGNNFWVRARLAPPILVFIQILLGIFTVLSSVHIIPGVWGGFEWLAQLHQLTGMLLLLSVINILYATK
ncbi:MAG: COX15/CtaA family protein [Bacteroidetes bacterium]|nr:COX15/CtaA family protein [Bacteroidota bacterium]